MHRSIILLFVLVLSTPSLVAAQPSGPVLSIPEIQGAAATSPFAGQKLARPLRGCVTGVAAEGFFLQDSGGDDNPATSDGIYVFRYSSWKNPRGLKPGDLVEISSYQVTEFYGQTELNGLPSDKNAAYRVLGKCTLPTPVPISAIDDPHADPAKAYESREGMRVIVDLDASVVGPTERFESRHPAGDPEITVVSAASPFFGRRVFAGDLPIDRGTLALSGGLGVDLPAANVFDHLAARGLTGVLAYQFGRYVLLVDNPAVLQVTSPAAALPSIARGGPDEWTLCTFNAENLFDAVDDGDGDIGDWTPANERVYRAGLERRAAVVRERLGGCTVLAVQEIEGKDAVWDDLTRALGPDYRFDYRESEDVRDITVGLIYDGTRVEFQGSTASQSCTAVDYAVNYKRARGPRVDPDPCESGAYPLYDRPPYVANLVVASASRDRRAEVRIVVVHLKSKRGDEAESGDRRVAQSRHVAELLAGEPGAAPLRIALGDFNDDLGTPALESFGAFVNLYLRHTAPSDQYSYIYNGRAQALDHIIMSSALDGYFLSGGPVHVNADFAEPLPGVDGRASDHDPLVVRFRFQPTGISAALLGAVGGGLGYHQPLRLK